MWWERKVSWSEEFLFSLYLSFFLKSFLKRETLNSLYCIFSSLSHHRSEMFDGAVDSWHFILRWKIHLPGTEVAIPQPSGGSCLEQRSESQECDAISSVQVGGSSDGDGRRCFSTQEWGVCLNLKVTSIRDDVGSVLWLPTYLAVPPRCWGSLMSSESGRVTLSAPAHTLRTSSAPKTALYGQKIIFFERSRVSQWRRTPFLRRPSGTSRPPAQRPPPDGAVPIAMSGSSALPSPARAGRAPQRGMA